MKKQVKQRLWKVNQVKMTHLSTFAVTNQGMVNSFARQSYGVAYVAALNT
jgi:hypothetical protein